jgi:hypothetical protein
MDDLKAWWNSPPYQAIIPLREKSAKTTSARRHLHNT